MGGGGCGGSHGSKENGAKRFSWLRHKGQLWWFAISKTAHRVWLRILAIALEKELTSLTMLNDYIFII